MSSSVPVCKVLVEPIGPLVTAVVELVVPTVVIVAVTLVSSSVPVCKVAVELVGALVVAAVELVVPMAVVVAVTLGCSVPVCVTVDVV